MAVSIIYTVLTILNLIAFSIGVAFLPAEVAIHYSWNGVVDGVGSAWVYVSLPAAAAILAGGIWAARLSRRERNVKITALVLAVVGVILAVLGWLFFALAAQGMGVGEATAFPFAIVSVLPLSLLLVFFGAIMPRLEPNHIIGIRTRATLSDEEVWRKTHRIGGYVFFISGILSAVCAVLFSCLKKSALSYVSVIIFGALLLFDCAFAVLYARLTKREEPPSQESGGEKNGE